MAQIYYDKDAELEFIQNKLVVIVGYGSQGHAQALNLRDSGVRVVVAVREGSKSYHKAVEDGFLTASIEKAAKEADIIQILIPDHAQGQVYQSEIAPNLTPGKVLGFSHGFNIHFGQITVPDNLDVIMVAPKGPGSLVRKVFEEGKGVPSLIAIHQDYSGNAKNIALAYAKGIGATRAGVIETTFAEETETDLFGEQAVLCGGISELIKAGFDTLTEAGYQPEIAYFECLHELKLIVDLIYEGGLTHMRNSVSDTAEYGDMIAGKRVINEDTRMEMRMLLSEIQTGQFAREWILENRLGRPVFNQLKRREENHPIEKIGKSLREMMAWIKK